MSEREVTFGLHKLVRDKLPDMMREMGQEPEIRQLENEELTQALIAKIIEEAGELDPTDPEYPKELADLKQAITDLIAQSSTDDVVEQLRQKDLAKRGGFLAGQYISNLRLKAGDPWIEYYRKNPERFPELSQESK